MNCGGAPWEQQVVVDGADEPDPVRKRDVRASGPAGADDRAEAEDLGDGGDVVQERAGLQRLRGSRIDGKYEP